jgi:hypothetical protein
VFRGGMARPINFTIAGEIFKKNGLISINFFRVYDSKYYLLSLPNKFSRLNY